MIANPEQLCPICNSRKSAGTTEIYVIQDGQDAYYFNVDKAKTIVSDGRVPLPLADSTVRAIVAVNSYDPLHLPHVDPHKPGILALRFGGLILLDGIHRAVRCLQEGLTFYGYMLAYEESLACIVKEEIASNDPTTIARKLRAVLSTNPGPGQIEAEIECTPEVLHRVKALLTPEENSRLALFAVARLRGRKQ